ncbi:MBL fold metallo-hydrolase [Sphingobium sufflavum]|uniref:alkyl sulfatase dimerization domain-containing protein n=1 Tax=Sphingobium sufflavum TaxID=1129547 RepID=UPI001F3FED6E|nr:alkyl sulfatase dimerization domain-containing protein [Sphingobium sufflavum]MCE7798078.1 MBL fold metallo-hydrolase [Sphingobium sufflavum]
MTSNAPLSDKGLRTADLVKSGAEQLNAIERADGIWESRGIGNSYLIITSEGDVLVNAGTLRDARRGKELFAKVSQNPIRHIILTQSHANQYGGLEIYKTPENEVIAHRIYLEDRIYGAALDTHYRRGSRRIFGGITGNASDLTPTQEVSPDVLIGDDGYAFDLGERRFEIIWTPGGETRSAVVLWLPRERIAIVGNLFGPLFGNHPNLNTMRGDKPRTALQFVDSVAKVRALNPELILTGHEDIRGAEHIQRELTKIIGSVQWVHDRTVEGMNEGKDLRSLMRDIRTPPELTLTEEYGKVAWNVRAIWHEYTGWFDPARGTTELYGVPPSSVAPALAELAGGAIPIAQRARAFVDEGRPLEALHLLDIALASEPASHKAREAKRDALLLLDQQTGGKNLWERMWIAAEIRDLDE